MIQNGNDFLDMNVDDEIESFKSDNLSKTDNGEKLYNYEDIDYIKKNDKNQKDEKINDLISNKDNDNSGSEILEEK